MQHQFLKTALVLVALCGSRAIAGDDLPRLIDSALQRAGDNAVALRKALDGAPDHQKEGVRFLIAHMPERDLKSVSADLLLNNVRHAYLAWNEAPWKDRISKEMFLNDVLPYATINEHRDDWRGDFYKRFKPLVADAQSPSEAAVLLNQKIFAMLKVRFSRGRAKADQSPYESIEAGTASCTGLSVLLVDACRAVGVPARFAGTPLWTNKSGNHSWVEIWDGDWHYTGAAEPAGGELDRAWFSGRAATAQHNHRLHAIYATSYQRTAIAFPLVWDPKNDDVYAVNVTDRYAKREQGDQKIPAADASKLDIEASLHAVAQLTKYLEVASDERPELVEQDFAAVALTRDAASTAQQLLWNDHVRRIKETRADEMAARRLTMGKMQMPFYYSVSGDKPKDGRSLYISLHGGGGAPKHVNDGQWQNQRRLYRVAEGVYLAPRAPTDAWNMWHQGHIDGMFDRLIENLIVMEDVDPNRVYLLGYSAGGDGVYRLAPRMADRWAAASMMAGHPGGASPLNLRNTPFTIHVGGKDGAYNRNNVARDWARQLDALQKEDPTGYVHWAKMYDSKGHWLDGQDAAALPWMAKHNRNPLPRNLVWRQENHPRFYWLAAMEPRGGSVVRAKLTGQQIDLQFGGIAELILRANDRMLNLDEIVTVQSRGKELYKGRIQRTIGTLAKTLAERGDPQSVFSAELTVKSTAEAQ